MVVQVGRDLRLAGHLDDHLLLHRHQGALEVQQEHGHPHQQRGKVSLGFISFGHTRGGGCSVRASYPAAPGSTPEGLCYKKRFGDSCRFKHQTSLVRIPPSAILSVNQIEGTKKKWENRNSPFKKRVNNLFQRVLGKNLYLLDNAR